MARLITAAVLIVLVMLVGLGSSDPKDESSSNTAGISSDVQINADWVGEVITPLEAKFVSCCDFFYDPKQEGKVTKQVELRFTVDENGNRGKFDDSGKDVTISYPGGIRVNPCFQETLASLKFPATGKKTRHIFRFEITPELEKAADALRSSEQANEK